MEDTASSAATTGTLASHSYGESTTLRSDDPCPCAYHERGMEFAKGFDIWTGSLWEHRHLSCDRPEIIRAAKLCGGFRK